MSFGETKLRALPKRAGGLFERVSWCAAHVLRQPPPVPFFCLSTYPWLKPHSLAFFFLPLIVYHWRITVGGLRWGKIIIQKGKCRIPRDALFSRNKGLKVLSCSFSCTTFDSRSARQLYVSSLHSRTDGASFDVRSFAHLLARRIMMRPFFGISLYGLGGLKGENVITFPLIFPFSSGYALLVIPATVDVWEFRKLIRSSNEKG